MPLAFRLKDFLAVILVLWKEFEVSLQITEVGKPTHDVEGYHVMSSSINY